MWYNAPQHRGRDNKPHRRQEWGILSRNTRSYSLFPKYQVLTTIRQEIQNEPNFCISSVPPRPHFVETNPIPRPFQANPAGRRSVPTCRETQFATAADLWKTKNAKRTQFNPSHAEKASFIGRNEHLVREDFLPREGLP